MKQEKSNRAYRKYDDAFKAEAINQILQGRSVKELSLSLGVSEGLLYQWKSKGSERPYENRVELKSLKRENRQLKEENDILKKALRIFSQNP